MGALIGLFAGAIVGKLAFGDFGAALLATVGFVAGLVASGRRQRAHGEPLVRVAPRSLEERVATLERRVAQLEQASAAAPVAAQVPELALADEPPATPGLLPAAEMSMGARRNRLWTWIAGGNTPARAGVVLLFIGVGFLLKYAAERLTVPIELRLAGVAAGGAVLLALGWRLRERRAAYATILQGAGVGVLYLTVFAAFRLYELVPPAAAFALLFGIVALSSWLAIREDAASLAVLGVLGGFAAPILASTLAGNHVVLFSYYALLNAGILFIAWFKAWRPLNLLGFACTFLVGTLWGALRYEPELFATTEPFLVLFFLFYVAIAGLYAARRSLEVRDYVDGTLVFGNPLLVAGLQYALVRDTQYAMAASALAASALYVALAKWLHARRRNDLRLMVESFVALGVVFATLAVAFALDARWTSATWALEGAAIVWVGLRQRRAASRWFGLGLQIAAGVAWAAGVAQEPIGGTALLNGDFAGSALVALAGVATAWLYHVHTDAADPLERSLAPWVLAWGVLWGVGGQWREIDRWVAPPSRVPPIVAALTADAVLLALVAQRARWPLARVPAALALPTLLAIALTGIFAAETSRRAADHLFAHGGAIAWPLAIAVGIGLLRHFERAQPGAAQALDWGHAGVLWLAVLVGTHELAWLAEAGINGARTWRIAAWGLLPSVALLAVAVASSGSRWPAGTRPRAYMLGGAAPLAASLVLWSLAFAAPSDGDAAPLPFVPLVNPVDLTQGFALFALATWAGGVSRAGVRDDDVRELRAGALALLSFVWLNALALRSVHHALDVPYAFDPMWRSPLVQAMLSILWTVCALATMVWSNRRGERAGWIAGASLLAVVVAKLFAVDLSRIGTVERIVSFIGVGLLLLLIGYLAPVPSRKERPGARTAG